MKKISLLLGAILFVSAGCGNKQDPFDGKPDAVKDGRLPVQKVQLPPPQESEAVRIDFLSLNTSDSVSFKEGEEGRLPIKIRVLEEDYESVFEVTNESDFPGATIDAAKSEFVWTPPKGFVFGGTKSEDIISRELQLNIRAFAKHKFNGDAAIFTRERSLKVIVQKFMGTPTITVSGLTDKDTGKTIFFMEDTNYDFEVKVQDDDAGARTSEHPRLEILGIENQTVSLAPFIRVNSMQADYRNRLFTYKMSLNMGKNNITENYSAAGFGLRAVSRFNMATAIHRVESGVLAKYGEIQTTWTDSIKMARGTKVEVPFLIYEGTSRAKLTVTASGNPTGSSVNCEEFSHTGILPCTFVWEIQDDEPEGTGDFDLLVTAHAGSYDTKMNSKMKKFTVKFQVTVPVRPRPPTTPTTPTIPPLIPPTAIAKETR